MLLRLKLNKDIMMSDHASFLSCSHQSNKVNDVLFLILNS